MKKVQIPTNWTPEQADSVYQFIQDIKDSIWRTYNTELQSHYRKTNGISIKNEETTGEYDDFDDNIPFQLVDHIDEFIFGAFAPFFMFIVWQKQYDGNLRKCTTKLGCVYDNNLVEAKNLMIGVRENTPNKGNLYDG